MSKHTCHAIGCRSECPPEHLMCSKHWGMVTSYAKERVYAEYQEGQCTRDGGPTPQWHSAADAAIYQVHIKELREIIKGLKSQNINGDKNETVYCSNETKLKDSVIDHFSSALTGKSREQFRDFAHDKGLSLDVIYSSHGEPFADEDTQTCWEIWQASRAAINRI